ncbi:MAG: hypothetical protein NC548_32585, partial [Lachnospiraceae bacterium]|nr:hypothetical protein [Lachnospiraceae bacterium]
VRVTSGYAAVSLDDTPLTAETALPIPYAVANKAASSCVIALDVVPEAAPVAEHTIRLVCEATSYDKSTTAVDTVEIRTVNPAPVEVRANYARMPLLLSESLPIDFAVAKADYTGNYTVVFTHTAGQGYCQGDYAVHDGEQFAVGGERAEFRLDYRPTVPGEHRLRFEVSDGTFVQEAEVYCEVFSQESTEPPTANGVYIHVKTYEGTSFYTAKQWAALEDADLSAVDGIAVIDGDLRILLPLHACEPLPFCGEDDDLTQVLERGTTEHYNGKAVTQKLHEALVAGKLTSAPVAEACYYYDAAYPGRWYLPDLHLLIWLGFYSRMEAIRNCMELVGGTLFTTDDSMYSCSLQYAYVLHTYAYYSSIVSSLNYGRQNVLKQKYPGHFFPVRDL